MRQDRIGLIWQDAPKERGQTNNVRAQPPIPDTGWLTPTQFPNLSAAKILSIDTETKDPNLITHGPGWARNDGHIVGFSICTEDWHKWYFPIRHEVEPEYNLDPLTTLRWANDVLGHTHQMKVGANLMYDIGWFRQEGVLVKGPLFDVQFAEALIDESKFSYSLDSIAKKYVEVGKDTKLVYQWCADYYGGKLESKQAANFYRTPPRLLGPYAEIDVVRPLQIYPLQHAVLSKEGLLDTMDMECRLIPLLVDMRFRGVAVNVGNAEKARDELQLLEQQHQDYLNRISGMEVSVNAAKSIEKVFKTKGYTYTKTAKGNPSFTKSWLEHQGSEISKQILIVRKLNKARVTFIENAILDKHVDGRIHTQFHPLRSNDGGTVSGRFSSSSPNLQQVPVRDEYMSAIIRGLFEPDQGFPLWLRGDYNQIEYRLLAHYAVGEGADVIRKMYRLDPNTDYHQATIVMIQTIVNIMLERKPAKSINFGLVYGMGKRKLCRVLGLTNGEGETLFAAYHEGVPFVSHTFSAHVDEAQSLGFISTILGRRSRFTRYVPIGKRKEKSLPYDEAVALYGDYVERAFTHKSLNRRLQGSAADIMKLGMLDAYEAGIFDELGGPPQLTVHDEVDTSYHPDCWRAAKRLKQCMEETIKLTVPVILDMEAGPNWANVKKITFEE